ncbi:MAG: hypothetical protein RIK87_22850 [Fuerstiella sp.]
MDLRFSPSVGPCSEQAELWHGLHARLIDGFTFAMPDTPLNQSRYPQQKAQTPGAGLSIA